MFYYYVALLTELRIHFQIAVICMQALYVLIQREIRALDGGGLVCKNPTRMRTQAEYFESAY